MTTAAPLPASITYVTFPSRTATAPTEHAAAWPGLAQRLTHHARRPGKDGPGWSPAVYKRAEDGTLPTRANDAVEALTCAVADVDHVELDDVVTLRDHVRGLGLAGALYSTHSSTELAPRVRVVVPLAEPVPAETWPRLWPTLAEQLFLGLADRAASDPGRLYYLPAAPPDALVIVERWDGLALDWRGLPLADPRPAADPIALTGAGPAQTVDPEDMPILERLFSGRRGEQRMRAWTGDYADFGGNASSADQSIANGLVVYCRGDVELAERIMRAGAWRPKWDERRGSTTWLGYTFGKALAAYRAWAGSQDAPDEPGVADETPGPPVDETCPQALAHALRELAQARATIAAQATNLRAERAQRQALAETVRAMFEVIAIPDEQMNARTKLVFMVMGAEAASRNSRGKRNLPNEAIAEGTGLPVGVVSEIMQDIQHREHAPIARGTTREWVTIDGVQEPRSVAWVTVETEDRTYVSLLRAAAAMGGPSDKSQQKKEQAKARAKKSLQAKVEAQAASWGECSNHDNPDVVVRGHCPDCGEVVGERTMPVDEFRILNPEMRDSGSGPPSTVTVRTKRPAFRDSGPSPEAPPPPEDRDHALRDSGPPPRSLLDYAGARPRPRDWICPAPGCRSLERTDRPDGSWRCRGRGHESIDWPDLAAAAGGAE